MSEHMLPGDPPIRVVLRRSSRARRYSLRISRLDGQVSLTIPAGASKGKGLAFLREKEPWIRRRLQERPNPVNVTIGAEVPLGGVPLLIGRGKRNRLRPEIGAIEISPRVERVGATVAGLLKAEARERLAAASDHYASLIGKDFQRITLRDTRSRWGSCSTDGALMYSWRLVLAPPSVLDYVAAHEVAHLAEMNHGPQFWAHVAELMPDYDVHRRWLRKNGEVLHRYRFTD